MVNERAIDAYRAFFEVPAKYKGQKPILFEMILNPHTSLIMSTHRMMKKMGYDLTKRSGLNFGKRKINTTSIYQKGKPSIIIIRFEGD